MKKPSAAQSFFLPSRRLHGAVPSGALAQDAAQLSPATGLRDALADSEVRRAIALSLTCAFWATLIGAVLGVPLAYLLARRSFPGKRFIEAIVDVPIVIPRPVAGIALL